MTLLKSTIRKKGLNNMALLSIGTNAKTIKSDKQGEFLTAILYLAPHKLSGFNVCPKAKNCISPCLNLAGMGAWSITQQARIKKTQFLFEHKKEFLAQLRKELGAFQKKCDKLGKKAAVRLNGTSDLAWHLHKLELEFPRIQFYDYTKVMGYLKARSLNRHFTFSYDGPHNWNDCLKALGQGVNVSVVFKGKLPKTFNGFPVISGDDTDLRFLDKTHCIVGLTAKGPAKKCTNGFVVIQ